MSKIKVLIVDDSATVRKVIGNILEEVSDIEVIGAVENPIFAMRRMEVDWPDVIVLDIEMPQMDGITFLKKIMAERPTPVVMCSTLTEKGSATAMKALALGALEVVHKPKAGVKNHLEDASGDLVNAIRSSAKANMKVVKRKPLENKPKLTADAIISSGKGPASQSTADKVVAIGTSTGGTQALEAVLTRLPRTAPGIVIVQHMPEAFTKAFAERLNSVCQIKVKEASENDRILPGQALIAPGGRHMLVTGRGSHARVSIKDGPPVSRHRPSVDVLFRATAKSVGRNALGIIMTGMGDDGASGLKEMHETGARTLGQNEATCVVYGMPAVAMKRGAVDKEVALEDIPNEIMSFGNA
jgi:two-component system, chemotaxis family, protein-glutamate methylesterase/glutaminase